MTGPMPSGTISAGAMNLIASLLEQRTGQQITANRVWRIETALKTMLRAEGLESADALVAKLLTRAEPKLAERVVDALLNQETSFFRDAAVLETAADALTSLQADVPHRRLRIWSAACATGQEPLSLAMLLAERGMAEGALAPEILASDVSPSALARARAGRYSQFEIQRGLPVRRMIEWFEGGEGEWVAKAELVRRIRFRRHNLAADPPPPGKFDLVLCRNVLLYFSPSLRTRVFDTLAGAVRPGGLLVLGAGETVIGQTGQFRPSEQFRGFYRLADPAACAATG
ncbi:CheR family methyltransferase [Sphingosinithalassobacter sp. CS137]|uniref:CheR family methyltransferase n=1 Tax=Sphingosinithalassobacter sp. CS137 TaxID=2762748 RepID=UPI0021D013E7|nr:protein-glutamate O-methyltransferase CheR [Sphingosinithalassobacter sp. CS137]